MKVDYGARIARAQREMAARNIDALIIGVGTDLYYFTGYSLHHSSRPTLLVIPRDGEPSVTLPAFERPKAEQYGVPFPITTWTETENPIEVTANIINRHAPKTIAAGDELYARWLIRLQHALAGTQWRGGGDITRECRMRKDAVEIAHMREAGRRISAAWVDFVKSTTFAGLTERQVAHRLFEITQTKGLDIDHAGIAAAGPNGASPHHSSSDRPLQIGDAVVFDWVGRHHHYVADLTRMIHIGEPSAEYRKAYEMCYQGTRALFNAVRPGIACGDLDKAARDYLTSQGYGQYCLTRAGHGLGLDVHEEPYLVGGNPLKLDVGMTFTNEPGVYIEGKFGIRIEDNLVCTTTGAESFTDAPRDLLVVA